MEVTQAFVPQLTPQSMGGEAVDLLGEAVGIQPFHRSHDARVERTSPLLEEAPVGDLVGEGMLERVLEVGKEPRFIEEFSGLEPVESPVEFIVGELSDRLEKPERDVFPDHRRGLQQAFVFWRDPIDAGRQDCLDRRRDLNHLRALRQPPRAPLSDQRLGLHKGPNALLEEEGVAVRPLDKQSLQWFKTRIGPEQAAEEVVCALGRQGVDPELPIVGLTAPAVMVLGPVVDQQQEPGSGQTLDQAVEQHLGLGVDPVQVLEQHQKRLHLAFPEKQTLHPIQSLLPPLRGIEPLPGGILHWNVQQREQCR